MVQMFALGASSSWPLSPLEMPLVIFGICVLYCDMLQVHHDQFLPQSCHFFLRNPGFFGKEMMLADQDLGIKFADYYWGGLHVQVF